MAVSRYTAYSLQPTGDVKCPQSHVLQSSYRGGWTCDSCQSRNCEKRYRCQSCDYDLCYACYEAKRQGDVKCPQSHVLQLSYRGGWTCDSCQSRNCEKRYRCQSCDYDLCYACYEAKRQGRKEEEEEEEEENDDINEDDSDDSDDSDASGDEYDDDDDDDDGLSLAFNGADQSCLRNFKEVIRKIQADDLSYKTAKNLNEVLKQMCELLSDEIQRKKKSQQDVMVEIERKTTTLQGKKIELDDSERRAKDAKKDMEDAKRTMDQKESEKRSAECKLDKKKDELKDKEQAALVVSGVGLGVSILTLGIGAGPALATSTTALAAITAMIIVVKDAEKEVDNARSLYNDARSVYNTASSNHSEAVDRKNDVERKVKQLKEAIAKLKGDYEWLQEELYCLGDLLDRMKKAEVELNRTNTTASALTQTLRWNRSLPSRFQDKKTAIAHCSELVAKFEVLGKMQVLAISETDTENSKTCIRQLETRGRQLRLEYDQAQTCLSDYC